MTYADTRRVRWDDFAHAEETRRAAERIDAEYHALYVDPLIADLRAVAPPDVLAIVDVFYAQRREWRRFRAAEHLEKSKGLTT